MRIALISVLGLLAACGGDDAITVNATQDNFCDQIAQVACHNMYQCCTEGEIESRLNVSEPRTELQCRADFSLRCDRSAADLKDSLAAGRVTFDATKLDACLNSIVAPTDVCSDVVMELPWKTACKDSAWVGTVATGGACLFDFDCTGAPDSFCGPNQKCQMKPTAGFPCGTGCASAYYCGTNNTCAPRLAEGAPCTGTTQCAKDLYCDTTQTMPVCAGRKGAGEACTSNLGCVSNECIPGTCMGTSQQCYTDTQCNSRCANNGAFCTTAYNCGAGNCSISGISCSSDLTCGSTGGSCVFPIQCLPGDCIGDPVCTSQTLEVDYCTSVSQLPL